MKCISIKYKVKYKSKWQMISVPSLPPLTPYILLPPIGETMVVIDPRLSNESIPCCFRDLDIPLYRGVGDGGHPSDEDEKVTSSRI